MAQFKQKVPLLVFDESLTFVAQIDNYQYLRWVRNWRRPHEWEFIINRYMNGVQELSIGRWIALFVGGKYRIGQIGSLEIMLDENGKASENFKFSGFDASGDFHTRIAQAFVRTGNGYDEVSNIPAETAMKHYVNNNAVNALGTMGQSLPSRNIEFLTIEPDQGRGVNNSYRARFQTLVEILQDISFVSELGYETIFDIANQELVFTVIEGVDRSSSQMTNPQVVFSTDFDNVEAIGFRHSIINSRTRALVAGQGEAQNREMFITSLGIAPTGRASREFYIDARDIEMGNLNLLNDRGLARLRELAPEIDLELQILQQGPFEYLVDYNLGDIVTAIYPGIATMDTRIIQAVEEYRVQPGENSFALTLGFGREFPDLRSAFKQFADNTRPEIRR